VPNEDRGFKKLIAWRKADQLASAVCHAVEGLPAQHRWLTSQVARAAISVPANVAEGYARGSLGDYMRFLDIARGSLSEAEYYIRFLHKGGLVSEPEVGDLSTLRAETGFLLHNLRMSLKAKSASDWDRTGGALQVREVAAERYDPEVYN
jgi:four helix bundle protein